MSLAALGDREPFDVALDEVQEMLRVGRPLAS